MFLPHRTTLNKPLCDVHVVGDQLAVITALSVHEADVRFHPAVHDGQLIEIFRLQRHATPVHWYQDFGPLISNMGIRTAHAAQHIQT
ncbi:hypothetical protein TNCT_618241 [Trichonephila clavata]|uniref:Uncharacterized protein n=1 Tax=Trichonephila clavata TaxID=2740835 RepID=A0A8X6GXH2_TRICU|nr:hypothetical protein TNCT_618241 [Trichonephila clavata]